MQHSHYIRDAFAKQELREGHLMMVSPLAVCIVVVLVRNTTFASKDQQQIIVFFYSKMLLASKLDSIYSKIHHYLFQSENHFSTVLKFSLDILGNFFKLPFIIFDTSWVTRKKGNNRKI